MPIPAATDLAELDLLSHSRASAGGLIASAAAGVNFVAEQSRLQHLRFNERSTLEQQLVGAKAAQELAVSAQARDVAQSGVGLRAGESQPYVIPAVVKTT